MLKKKKENGNNGDKTRVESSPMTACLECTIMNNSEMQSGTSEILDNPDVQITTDKNSKTKTGTLLQKGLEGSIQILKPDFETEM